MSVLLPAYLIGLLGLALPWLLHRFSDQQPEEQVFPSNQFLEPTRPPVSRTRKLKYLMLLALRVLSVLLLCFLFAQPWIARKSSAAAARMHHIVSVDQSLSMRAQGRWDSAVMHAKDIISRIPGDDSVVLVGFADTANIIADGAQARSSVTQALDDMQPGYAAGDYGVLMQRLNALGAEQHVPVKVWLITDQQKSALPAQLNALYAPQVAEFEFVPVLTEEQRNVHVSADAASSNEVNVRLTVTLRASTASADGSELLQTSDEEQVPSTVRVSFNEQVLAERRVSLGRNGVETLVFDDIVMPLGNEPVLIVSVMEPDALNDDNQVSLIIRQANPTPVVLLQTDRTASVNASVFVTTALETDSLASVETLNGTAERAPPESSNLITGRALSGSSLAMDVLQFVDDGGNALVYDSQYADVQANISMKGVEIGLIDESHPMALSKIDWFGTRFYNLGLMVLHKTDRVLLETSDRQPVLVERSTERGRLLLLNDRLDGQSSNLPLQPAFVGLMQAVLRYFDASTVLPDQLLVGDRLSLPGNVQLMDPKGNPLLALGSSGRLTGITLDEPGLYSVIGVRGEHTMRLVLDAQESDLSVFDTDALSSWQARYTDIDTADNPAKPVEMVAADLAEFVRGDDTSRYALWKWMLPLLVVVMLLEIGVANRRLDIRRDGS